MSRVLCLQDYPPSPQRGQTDGHLCLLVNWPKKVAYTLVRVKGLKSWEGRLNIESDSTGTLLKASLPLEAA